MREHPGDYEVEGVPLEAFTTLSKTLADEILPEVRQPLALTLTLALALALALTLTLTLTRCACTTRGRSWRVGWP